MSRSSRFTSISVLLAVAACGLAGRALTQETRAADPVRAVVWTPVEARDAALRWLSEHQERDGHWSAAGFQALCPKDDRCSGAGGETQDVLVTSLCLMAFMGGGNTTVSGRHQTAVAGGIAWLRANQDPDGLFGSRQHQSLLHAGHGVATLAMSEAFLLGRVPELETPAQKGIDYILKFRTKGGAWNLKTRAGDVSSATIWMLLAVASAKESGLAVPDGEEVRSGIVTWLDERTDPNSGLIARVLPESRSRDHARADQPPPSTDEALCAAGLLCRVFLGQNPNESDAMQAAAKTLTTSLGGPAAALPIDPCLLYLGSFAMFQMGRDHWTRWKAGTLATMLARQHQSAGHLQGSWDPTGPWALQGGRIGATAMNVLATELHCRMASFGR